jgi:AcrR family transcriptional regulator
VLAPGGRPPGDSDEEDGWAAAVAAHKDRTRARILAAAADLVAARGAAGLAMTTLARRARVARATLYNYFPSAERVLEALVETEVAAFLAALDRRLEAASDPGERLEEAISALVSWVAGQSARGPAPSRRGLAVRPPDIASIHRPLAASERRAERVIAAARDAGALPPGTEPDLAARFVVTLVFGIRWQLGGTGADHVAAALRAFLLGGLGARSLQPVPAIAHDGLADARFGRGRERIMLGGAELLAPSGPQGERAHARARSRRAWRSSPRAWLSSPHADFGGCGSRAQGNRDRRQGPGARRGGT